MKPIKLLQLLVREHGMARTLQRTPESEQMNDAAQVAAFHEAGEKYLVGLYHFNAMAIAAMVPEGGRVVDLGSGSAQFIAHLAQVRPDLKIIGIELAERMVLQGRRLLAQKGLSERVEIWQGDMTDFSRLMREPVSLVSSVFSLHHLPALEHLARCLAEIHCIRRRDGAAVWVFDHARPRSLESARRFPEIFTPEAAPVFNLDSTQSLMASWTLEEMSGEFTRAGLAEGQHLRSRILPLYQVHRLPPAAAGAVADAAGLVSPLPLSAQAKKDFDGLRWLFPAL
ncbi:class I SAM-dependent methyltransferase [Roseateles sp.]|uniref:class I SAM-dependent methyltransferase n=1 Tax=Roseateles sp. TaxID=1971397 RepID=UPI002DF902C4|nr:class I SAM-dependent methyltransferase [Roseateles sp.]